MSLLSQVTDSAYQRLAHLPPNYIALLDRIHHRVVPRGYLEIGVANGRTLALAMPQTAAVGIDPKPRIRSALGPNFRVFETSSDDFFADNDVAAVLGYRPLDLAFIDGMHLFEFALRDFMNVEHHAHKDTTVLVHDCRPIDEVTQRRERETEQWTGDIWKLVLCLKQWRPDLRVAVVDVKPSGLGIIGNLDPSSRVLADNYGAIEEQFVPMGFDYLEQGEPETMLNLVPNDWKGVQRILPGRQQRAGVSAHKARVVARGAARAVRARLDRAGPRLKRSPFGQP